MPESKHSFLWEIVPNFLLSVSLTLIAKVSYQMALNHFDDSPSLDRIFHQPLQLDPAQISKRKKQVWESSEEAGKGQFI